MAMFSSYLREVIWYTLSLAVNPFKPVRLFRDLNVPTIPYLIFDCVLGKSQTESALTA